MDSLKNVSHENMLLLCALGAAAMLLVLHLKGYLVVPGKQGPRPQRPSPETALAAQLRQALDRLDGKPAAPEPLARVVPPDPLTAQALVENRKAAEAAIARRKKQLQDELLTLDSLPPSVAG